ncbi:hypothetical protein QAD02_023050 [Eretmocerus hayati]|uniref:Uncharacterized protein n=1 Tax=Eretmocerus hayati TaxID=131215 RepID=A0ACC2PWE0_9HYME|nr:hypothetical protein QAD02_023050 [Eretmocerus hayati]
MPDEELTSLLDETIHINKILKLENEVLQQFLKHKDPQSLRKLPQIEESARVAANITRLHNPSVSIHKTVRIGGSASSLGGVSAHTKASSTPSLGSAQFASGSTQFASGSQTLSGGGPVSRAGGRGRLLTVAHRTALANKEVEMMRQEYTDFERAAFKKKEGLIARMKEIKKRMRESEEAVQRFENEVANGHSHSKIPVEKFTRFIEVQSKNAAKTTDMINLKIVTAKRLIKQTKKQNEIRREWGSGLRPIDFEKLRIENEYLINENDENHRDISSLKKIGAYYNMTLKNQVVKLFEKKAELQNLQDRGLMKKKVNIKHKTNQKQVKKHVKNLKQQLEHIKDLANKFEGVPEVDDFLNIQKQLQEAREKFKIVSRRRKIQLFEIHNARKRSEREARESQITHKILIV